MSGDNEGPPALSLGLSTLGCLVSVAFHAEGPSHPMGRGAPSDGDVREPVVYKALFWALPCKGADASPAHSPLDGCLPLGTGPHHPKPSGSLGPNAISCTGCPWGPIFWGLLWETLLPVPTEPGSCVQSGAAARETCALYNTSTLCQGNAAPPATAGPQNQQPWGWGCCHGCWDCGGEMSPLGQGHGARGAWRCPLTTLFPPFALSLSPAALRSPTEEPPSRSHSKEPVTHSPSKRVWGGGRWWDRVGGPGTPGDSDQWDGTR